MRALPAQTSMGPRAPAAVPTARRAAAGIFAGDVHLPLDRQFEQVRQVMDHKWEDTLYIPYFQAHTNTYAPLPVLREKFEQALNFSQCGRACHCHPCRLHQ